MSDARLVGSTTRFGHTLKSWEMDVPWDHNNPNTNDTLTIFAREIVPPKGEELPLLVYLQGGPGFPSPRPTSASGWLGEFLKHYRVLLLDQRGTGRSGRVDKVNVLPTERYPLLRADSIVADCEAFRHAFGVDTWSLFGQSFGGFCITTYASMFPESLEKVFLTGGLPAIDCHADDIYRATFDKLQFRHDQFYRHFPWIEARIREVCAHLDQSDELLPTGERLSSRRLRTIGIELGRDRGFDTLAYLFEDPFVTVKGEKKLRSDFLNSVGSRVSFEQGPLYAVVHESIYGGTVPGPTNWSAHRIREDKPGFEEHADPTDMTRPFYLTGEHIFPWQFEEDPALRPFIDAAHALAAKDDWRSLYDKNSLGHGPAVEAAAIYVDDVFVPFEHSMNTARVFRDLRPFITNAFQHDGIHWGSQEIITRLITTADEY